MNSFGALCQNLFLNRNRYRVHQDAVIISCFYNPQNNPHRLIAFQKWYRSVKHLPHRIIECLIGNAKSQLPKSPNITQVHSNSLLWHKEALLNKVIRELPKEFKYVFWVDADVLFTNLNWIRDGVERLQSTCIIQPFEYCIHLDKGELKPSFDVDSYRGGVSDPKLRHPSLWRSFCSNIGKTIIHSKNYDTHGHVGFAWGARRELLDACPLYDKALIGGADHIIAHAATGSIPHSCIEKAFADNISEVNKWSMDFYETSRDITRRLPDSQLVNYVPGDLYHIWHGDVKARDYLNAVKNTTGTHANITDKDENGLYVAKPGQNDYIKKHYPKREADDFEFDGFDPEFLEDMGYNLAALIDVIGKPTYSEPATPHWSTTPKGEDWLLQMAEKENGGIISAGGLITRMAEEPQDWPSPEVAPPPREVENFS